jgi:hypothetical protein
MIAEKWPVVLTTSHPRNVGAPSAVSKNVSPGTIANWANYEITRDDSLIEASFVVPEDYTVAVVDVDISDVYVVSFLHSRSLRRVY